MPRLGTGMPIVSSVSSAPVTLIEDFLFESRASGEITPILTTSRTNLVTSSEDFTSGWSKDDVTISANSTTAPDGTSTADKIIGNANSSRHNIVDTGLTNTVTGSFSVHAKAGELRYLQVASANTATQYANFDLLTGEIGTIGGDFANVAMDSLANGWYRITLTSVNKYNNFYLSLVSGLTASWLESWSMSNDTDGLFLWGAQLEEDGFASAYIPTSGSTVTVSTTLNDTSEVWDFDGTDITLQADPEDEGFWEEGSNLVLNHDYEDLGSELITNGGFDADSNWAKQAGWTISGGTANFVEAGGNRNIYQTILTVGKTYKLTYTVLNYVSGSIRNISSASVITRTANGTYTEFFTAHQYTSLFLNCTENSQLSIDNVSVKQVDPNDRWSLTNTTISDGVLNFPDNSSAAKFAIHSNTSMMDIGSTYEITLTVNKTAGGVLKILSGTGGSDLTPAASVSSSGTHTFIATNNTNGSALFLYTTPGENFQGTVDNVTVKEYAIQPKDI